MVFSLLSNIERMVYEMENRYLDVIRKILSNEIKKAETMVTYTTEFEDKTAVGRWKMAVFQLKCLYEKIDTAFALIQEGSTDEEIFDLLNVVDKQLFMKGPKL